MKNILIYGCIAVAGLFMLSCNPEPQPDPCAGVKATSADFKIEEVLSGSKEENGKWVNWDRGFEATDTTYSCQSLRFTANEELESYQWQIGADTTVYRSRTFNLNMGCATGYVTVRLIGKRRPNTSCNPTDDGIDTVTKKIYLVNSWRKLPYFGRYEGYYDNDPQKLERVSFYMDSTAIPGIFSWALDNVPAGAGPNVGFNTASYAFWIMPGGLVDSGYNLYGWGVTYLQDGKRYLELDIAFHYPYPNHSAEVKRKFKGVKYEDLY